MERKPSTVQDYSIMLRRHLEPFFGRSLERITPDHVVAYMAAKSREGLATKTVNNHLNFLHGVFAYAVKRGWVRTNPVEAADRARSTTADPDIRFLDQAELEAVIRKASDDLFGPTDRTIFLTAAMTGLRRGELLALRWKDVDWTAGKVRVRRNYVRGQYGTPKSKRLKPAEAIAQIPEATAGVAVVRLGIGARFL